MIATVCPSCWKQADVDARHAGRKFKCKGCGASITVPDQASAALVAGDPDDAPSALAPPAPSPVIFAPAARTPEDRRHRELLYHLAWVRYMLAAVVLLLGAILFRSLFLPVHVSLKSPFEPPADARP